MNHQHEILPGLWIGDSYSRKNSSWLSKEGIRVIINCTPDLEFVNMSSIFHYRYPMRDGAKGDSNWKAMKNGSDVILKHYGYWITDSSGNIHHQPSKKEVSKVLVHCHQGLSRSASVIGCYLIRYCRWSGEGAIGWIKSRRPGSLNYLGFRKMLWKWDSITNKNDNEKEKNNTLDNIE